MFEDVIAKYRGISMSNVLVKKRYNLVALLLRSKKVVHFGFNDYSRTYVNRKVITAFHAEHNCCKKFDKIKDTLLVLRFGKNGDLKNASPCSFCREMLLSKGIRYIYCSNNEGIIEKVDLRILKNYMSVSQRNIMNLKINGQRNMNN